MGGQGRGLRRLAFAALAALLTGGVLLLVAPAVGQAQGAPTATATVRTEGYLTMADGTQLAYTLVRPDRPGPLPTLFEYSGYFPGRSPDAAYIRQFVERDGGYAYLGVNIRGTGCSSGTWDFFDELEAPDGAAAIAWVRQQPWSNGLVGMIGKSFPGITQLFVAEQRPPGLVAIAPGHFFADAYRDLANPGGLTNYGFASLWSFVGRPSYEVQGSPAEVAAGDLGCLRGLTNELTGLPTNPVVQLVQHPFDDPIYDERSPDTHLEQLVDLPMLATLSWQDEQLGSRQTDLLARHDDLGATQWWATLTNGDHSMARTAPELADLERFYDHFLKGEDNGWGTRPRVQVWWDSGRDGERAPGWVTGLDHWSEAHRTADGTLTPWALHLASGGALVDGPAVAGDPPDTYAYVPVAGSQGIANPYYAYSQLPFAELWPTPPPPGTSLAFTTPALAEDTTLLGSASLDLWISAATPDVDLQVTITEVRPDGQETFVQQGWLRASHRTLDPDRSTELRPYQTHEQVDAAPLAIGEPTPVRVEVFPFGHVFRAGSHLRAWVVAPTFLPPLWAFVPTPTPSVVTVLHDADHPSRLVLPRVPNDPGRVASLPGCGTLIHQPCRPNPIPVTAATAAAPTPAAVSPATTSPTGRLPATGAAIPITPALIALGLALVALRRHPARQAHDLA
jgi:putative CocE/NonD family hydrolase